MREPSEAVIDRLGDDVARLEAEADAVWAVLDAAGIDVQLGVDTLADGVGKLVKELNVARSAIETASANTTELIKEWSRANQAAGHWSARYRAAAEVLRGLGDTLRDWEDGADG